MAKYRTLFLEESTEHLAEMSSALLALEKAADDADAIDRIFRMAHSIKGMAASLEYDSIGEIAHGLEDRMQDIRAIGRMRGSAELDLLFRGLECLEAMVRAIRDTGEPPPPEPALARILAAPFEEPSSDAALGSSPSAPFAVDETAKKKLQTLMRSR